MARMKRIANRYGKVTLASLGGCLMTLGAFLIVLSAATVTNVAEASTSGCGHQFSSPQPNYECTFVDMYGDGSYTYYDCCHECGFFPIAAASDPNYDCTACYDYSGDGVNDTCDCCTATTRPCPTTPATCDSGCNGNSGYDGPAQSCSSGYPSNFHCGNTPNGPLDKQCNNCRCTGTPSFIGPLKYITCNCQ